MLTPAVMDLPRPPRIPRARCAGCISRLIPVPSMYFLSDYLWKFNNALPRFLFGMYADFRYGRIPFRFDRLWLDGAWTYDPNYGWTYASQLPSGELTIPPDTLKVNVDGTTYTKAWDGGELVASIIDTVSVTESVEVSISDIIVYHSQYYAPAISKKGVSHLGVEEAWALYDAASVEGGEGETWDGGSAAWGCSYTLGGYSAGGTEMCLVFDTSDTPEAASVTLRLEVASFNDVGYGTPVLELYRIDSAFSTSHYLSGTYITNKEISSTGTHLITLSNDDINYGGTTRIKLSLDSMDGDRIMSAYVQDVVLTRGINSNTRLIFTY